PATLTVYVDDIEPVIAKVVEDELPSGITDGDGEDMVAPAARSTGSAARPGPGARSGRPPVPMAGAAAISGGVPLVYGVVGNMLTATAGGATIFALEVEGNGDYTFTLEGPVDHPLGNGDDDEILVMDFSSLLQASDGGSPLTLSGGFLVQIEDDVPQALANDPVQLDDDVLAGGIPG